MVFSPINGYFVTLYIILLRKGETYTINITDIVEAYNRL